MIARDNERVFQNAKEFAEEHTWDGKTVTCTLDHEAAQDQRYTSMVNIAWMTEAAEVMVYISATQLKAPPLANQTVLFDRRQRKVLRVVEHEGIYGVLLSATTTGRVR